MNDGNPRPSLTLSVNATLVQALCDAEECVTVTKGKWAKVTKGKWAKVTMDQWAKVTKGKWGR